LSDFHQRVVSEVTEKLAHRQYRISSRKCPQCRKRFFDIEVDGMPLQYCRGCRSWWFDAHELMHFTAMFQDAADGDLAARASSLVCPVCDAELREQQLIATSNLMVHTCPEGHGVYLENGEFTRAMEDANRVEGLMGHLNDQHLGMWRELQAALSQGEFHASEIACCACGEALIALVVDGVELDYCMQCESCWFDAHELQHFTDQARDVPGDHLASRETERRCPKCSLYLRRYQFHPESNVTIEACPSSHGVFLHGGQFPRVMQASESLA
jgi:Zn-finger nucleic acid-binding protein